MVLYLFDIDGTILLTGGAGTHAINQVMLARHGIDNAMDGVSAAGKTDSIILDEIFRARLGRAAERHELDALIEEYVPALEAAFALTGPFNIMPHVYEILDWLEARDDVTLGIATGNVQGGARAKLLHIDVWHRFAFGGYGDDAEDRAGLVARAIERGREHVGADVPEDRIVVVGDTPRDVEAARACGVPVVAVATGSSSAEKLRGCGPTAVLETLAELPAWHQSRYG
jgi:phosphoglycolate phosphatase-like HAD superfamily hydrolase